MGIWRNEARPVKMRLRCRAVGVLVVCLISMHFNDGADVTMLEEALPPAGDLEKTTAAREASAETKVVAKAASAAGKVDGASAKAAKQMGKVAAASKAQAG